jgi:hypothetical protein
MILNYTLEENKAIVPQHPLTLGGEVGQVWVSIRAIPYNNNIYSIFFFFLKMYWSVQKTPVGNE